MKSFSIICTMHTTKKLELPEWNLYKSLSNRVIGRKLTTSSGHFMPVQEIQKKYQSFIRKSISNV